MQIIDKKSNKYKLFTYLGRVLTEDGMYETEIRRGIEIANDLFQNLIRILTNRKTSL